MSDEQEDKIEKTFIDGLGAKYPMAKIKKSDTQAYGIRFYPSVYCIAPATAGVLAQLASGAADDPVALLATTMQCPIVLCPAMNDAMWGQPSVQQNVATLQERGLEVLGPVEGHLAEGYDAVGRMVEPDEIVARLSSLLGVE